MLGGQVRRNYSSVYGSLTLRCLENLNVDKLFLGANSVSLAKGLTTPNDSAAEVKKALISVSNEVIALVDSSKFDRVSLYKFIDCSEVGTIITDSGLDPEILEEFRANGIHLDLVSK